MRRKRGWMPLRVKEIFEETHDTKTLYLEDAEEGGRAFDYYAGQYLTFRFDTLAAKPLVRSYTLSSSPNQKNDVAFTVKKVPDGIVSHWLCDEIKVGDILKARGPIGRFCYEPDRDHAHLFMVAAGSGVTPFVSIMREYATKLGEPNCPKELTLLVSYRSAGDLILWHELKALSKMAHCRVVITLSREKSEEYYHGRINETLLAEVIAQQYHKTTFMTCGPQPMMDMLMAHVAENGVAKEHAKQESFES